MSLRHCVRQCSLGLPSLPPNCPHAGMAINLVALLVSGTASSIWLLLFGRALQGVGQGCDGPSGSALILSGFSERKRGRVLGIREGMGALAPSVGIIVGGMVLGQVQHQPSPSTSTP